MCDRYLTQPASEIDVDQSIELDLLGFVAGLVQVDIAVGGAALRGAFDESPVLYLGKPGRSVVAIANLVSVQPFVESPTFVPNAEPVGLLLLQRERDEVFDPHDLGRHVAVDVEDIVVVGAVQEDVDLEQLRDLGRQ